MVPDNETAGVRSYLLNHPSPLVTQDDRPWGGHPQPRMTQKVGMADTRGNEPHAHLVGARLVKLHVLDQRMRLTCA